MAASVYRSQMRAVVGRTRPVRLVASLACSSTHTRPQAAAATSSTLKTRIHQPRPVAQRLAVSRRWIFAKPEVSKEAANIKAMQQSEEKIDPIAEVRKDHLRQKLRAKKAGVQDVYMKGVKANGSTVRFYNDVSVVPSDTGEGWAVKLGGRFVLTPAQNRFQAPTHTLAQAMALEWDSQGAKLRPTSMPITHIVVTALDQVQGHREKFIGAWRGCTEHDQICYRTEHPRAVVKLQTKYWDPLLQWAQDTYGITLKQTTAVWPLEQDAASIDRAVEYMLKQSPIEMAALDTVVDVTKSTIISMAFAEGLLSVQEAWDISRLHENHQIKEWGKVEGIYGHSIDMEFVMMKLGAARAVLNMLKMK